MPKPGIESGFLAIVMMRFDFKIHQRFELELIHVAADDESQIVLNEFDGVMIIENQRAFFEQLAFRWILDHALESHHAFLACDRKQVVHDAEQREVVILLVLRALHQ
jgi:hypothetical protein